MLQSLAVISVNLWDVIISFANLVLLFLIIKKFLYKPVKNILAKRQSEIDMRYESALEKEKAAQADKDEWEKKMKSAEAEADDILASATDNAKFRSEKIVSDAKLRAENIIRQAEVEAELEHKKSIDGIKREIVEVSGALAEKMLEREIDNNDHRNLIDSFIEKIGDGNDGNQ